MSDKRSRHDSDGRSQRSRRTSYHTRSEAGGSTASTTLREARRRTALSKLQSEQGERASELARQHAEAETELARQQAEAAQQQAFVLSRNITYLALLLAGGGVVFIHPSGFS